MIEQSNCLDVLQHYMPCLTDEEVRAIQSAFQGGSRELMCEALSTEPILNDPYKDNTLSTYTDKRMLHWWRSDNEHGVPEWRWLHLMEIARTRAFFALAAIGLADEA